MILYLETDIVTNRKNSYTGQIELHWEWKPQNISFLITRPLREEGVRALPLKKITFGTVVVF